MLAVIFLVLLPLSFAAALFVHLLASAAAVHQRLYDDGNGD